MMYPVPDSRPHKRGDKGRSKAKGKGRGTGCSFKGHSGRIVSVKTNLMVKRAHEDVALRRGAGERPQKAHVVDMVNTDFLVRHCEVKNAHDAAITAITMTCEGVLTASLDGYLKLWKPVQQPDGRYMFSQPLCINVHEEITHAIAQDRFLFCGLMSGKIWAKSAEREHFLVGHQGPVEALFWYKSCLLSASENDLRVWLYDESLRKFNLARQFGDKGKNTFGTVKKMFVMSDVLVMCGSMGITMIPLAALESAGRPTLRKCKPEMPAASMLAYQHHVIVAFVDGSLRVYDVAGTLKAELIAPHRQSDVISCLSLAGLESGPRLVLTHARGFASTVDLAEFKYKAHFKAFERSAVECVYSIGHDGLFLMANSNGHLQLWQRLQPPQCPLVAVVPQNSSIPPAL